MDVEIPNIDMPLAWRSLRRLGIGNLQSIMEVGWVTGIGDPKSEISQ